jgi:hypothetical protein
MANEEEDVDQADLQPEPKDPVDSKDPVDPEPEEDLQALRDRAALADDLEAKNKQLFERAKKAEGFTLVNGEWVKAPKAPAPKPKANDELSGKDILALSTSGITEEEDIEILQKAAKINGTTIAQAIKDPVVAGILKGKQEERQTALASSTSSTRRTSSERKGSDILASAKADNMPAPGRDMKKMVRASLGLGD